MKRTFIAAAWIAGATLPVVAGFVFLFGCCVLPFHAYIHKAMPLCELAAEAIGGEQADHHHSHQQPLPARERQEPVKRLATDLPRSSYLAELASRLHAAAPVPAAAYRSFITLGALRCDQDVGLHVLVNTFLV